MEFTEDSNLDYLTLMNNYLCVGYTKNIMSTYDGIVITEYTTKKVLENISLKFGQINGVSNNYGLLIQGKHKDHLSIYVYDIINKKVTDVLYTYEDSDIYDESSSLYDPFLYEKKLFFLGCKHKSNGYKIKEIGIYDTSSDQKIWLTNNNKNKEHLDVFIRD